MHVSKDINGAASILEHGGIGAFPTETVYGLGADAFNTRAVARIFEVKRRPSFDPLIVHVATSEELELLVQNIPADVWKLREEFWPGPLTVVLPKQERVPDIVTSGLESIAVRWPSHPMALELIQKAGTPIAAPSANLFGTVSPTTAQHVAEQLGDGVDFILDGGPSRVGVESTILSFLDEYPRILRQGGVPQEELERVLGRVDVAPNGSEAPEAPGMLKRHYAPRTRISFNREDLGECDRIGLLRFKGESNLPDSDVVETLSDTGDLREAAANLFSLLRKFDKSDLDGIVVERLPDRGLGRAINERLEKACASHP